MNINHYKTITLLCASLLIIFFLGQDLSPFSNTMFEFHDETQPARIQQFTYNLQHLKIPPRIAPDFSFGMGYPVFNYYSPFTYWLTSMLVIVRFSVVHALKMSFLLALLTAFISTYSFLKQYFRLLPSLAGGVVYVSALYFAVDIFIRGNLAETWFIALLPLGLYTLKELSDKPGRGIFMFNTLVFTALFSAHNLLSLLAIPIILTFIFLLEKKKLNLVAFFISFGINAYFFIPLLLETSLTNATAIAQITEYQKHFLCPIQLWDSVWGYGGSIEGCADGIPFKLGKFQVLLLGAGLATFILLLIYKKENNRKLPLFFAFLTIGSLFLTTYFSRFIWDIFAFALATVQFPWRFIAFSLIGISFFTAYFLQHILRFPGVKVGIVLFSLFILYYHSKYFTKPQISQMSFEEKYLSQEFIEQEAAYKIPEYLPKQADYQAWVNYSSEVKKGLITPPTAIVNESESLKILIDEPYFKELQVDNMKEFPLNLHYFPFWQIKINNKEYIPIHFDQLARPTIIVDENTTSKVIIAYRQTDTELVGNILTIFSMVSSIFVLRKSIWNKLLKINT